MTDTPLQVRYEQEGRVARLVLNRPQYRNAQSRHPHRTAGRRVSAGGERRRVGVIVLCGEGEHFSAGHDLGTPEELADREARPVGEGLRGRYKRSLGHEHRPHAALA